MIEENATNAHTSRALRSNMLEGKPLRFRYSAEKNLVGKASIWQSNNTFNSCNWSSTGENSA